MDLDSKAGSGSPISRDPASPPATPAIDKNPLKKADSRDGSGAISNGVEWTKEDEAATRGRTKSSLRLKYEAETQVIERKIGSLEAIRSQLGLSQRKIAQLLLVDPSAWTRWTKGGDTPPPHIYRMLQWYLALEEKYPALDVNFWLNTVAQIPAHTAESDKFKHQLNRRTQSLEQDLADAKFEIGKLEAGRAKQLRPKLSTQIRIATYVLILVVGVAFGLFIRR